MLRNLPARVSAIAAVLALSVTHGHTAVAAEAQGQGDAAEANEPPDEDSAQSVVVYAGADAGYKKGAQVVKLKWYGLRILPWDMVLVGTTAFMFASARTRESELYPVALVAEGAGILVYTAAGPIVHAKHHNGGTALASLALRLTIPIVAAGIAGTNASERARHDCYGSACNEFSWDGVRAALIAYPLAALVTSAFDIGVLAYEQVPAQGTLRANVLPVFDPTGNFAGLRLHGTW